MSQTAVVINAHTEQQLDSTYVRMAYTCYLPVHERPLGVHQIELMVKPSPGLSDGGGVAQHAHGTLNLGEVSTGNGCGWLVVDSHLQSATKR